MQHIAGPVYGLLTQFGFLNWYVIDTGTALILVDTGLNAGSIATTAAALDKAGKSLDDVTHVFITHEHYDHAGGLAALQARTRVTTYAHPFAAAIIRGESPPVYADLADLGRLSSRMRRALDRQPPLAPATVDIEVQDGDSLDDLWPGLRVVGLPGHSYGQVGYHLTNERILIGGDVATLTPIGVRMPLRAPSPDWDAAKESLRKVGGMDVEVLCVGHGRPLTAGASAKIAAFAARLT